MRRNKFILPSVTFVVTLIVGLLMVTITQQPPQQQITKTKAAELCCSIDAVKSHYSDWCSDPDPARASQTTMCNVNTTTINCQSGSQCGTQQCTSVRLVDHDPLANCGTLDVTQCGECTNLQACPVTPTQPPIPTDTPSERQTPIPQPSTTPKPTNTPVPSKTPIPSPTVTGMQPSNTPPATPTVTSVPPTNTPIPSNTPVPSATPSPAPNACGYTQCDSAHPCNNGLTCVTASNDKSYCAIPDYQDACKNNPSYDTCCRSTPNACGYTQCDSQHPCQNGLTCVTAKNDKSYCSKPENVTACKNSPSMDTCCAGPTPTPTEIVIAKGGVTNTPVPPTIPSAGTPIQWIVVAAPLLLVALGLLF